MKCIKYLQVINIALYIVYVYLISDLIIFITSFLVEVYSTMYGRNKSRTAAGQHSRESQCSGQAHICKYTVKPTCCMYSYLSHHYM